MTQPHILITNDDGLHAPGIKALYLALKQIATVTVVAPVTEQSGVSQKITFTEPLRVLQIETNGSGITYGIHGTPSDCVQLGVNAILESPPDLIISGINQGANNALTTFHSGTAGAAREGALLGIPSIAVSLASHTSTDFSYASHIAVRTAQLILKYGLPQDTFLNINVPAKKKEEINGIRVTSLGMSRFRGKYKADNDHRGKGFYWMVGALINFDQDNPFSDTAALQDNAVSITPILLSQTNNAYIETLKQIVDTADFS
ncbi:MAG: 5'/3'-nucleotidase SurE [Candidatus Auribacter fodinae]|jgi:5'-nucleotidase|uniref:5'-nucleotidase SurE n=1 Tax=Candidatus Auribacter fodinae TaxID=2093366 RepID=A0A3A4R540_9BACT|nr:MAG: 5'/3'-nucleotidase SurE [Candidatus Auribacter fodinae]